MKKNSIFNNIESVAIEVTQEQRQLVLDQLQEFGVPVHSETAAGVKKEQFKNLAWLAHLGMVVATSDTKLQNGNKIHWTTMDKFLNRFAEQYYTVDFQFSKAAILLHKDDEEVFSLITEPKRKLTLFGREVSEDQFMNILFKLKQPISDELSNIDPAGPKTVESIQEEIKGILDQIFKK